MSLARDRRRAARARLLDPPDVRGGRAPEGRARRREHLRLHAGEPRRRPPAEVLAALARLAAENPPAASTPTCPTRASPQAREAVARASGAENRAAVHRGAHPDDGRLGRRLQRLSPVGARSRRRSHRPDAVLLRVPLLHPEPRRRRWSPWKPDEDFLPDVGRIAAAITPRTKAIIINTPNNPTGRVYPEAVLRELDRLISSLDHPVTVISDEPYTPIVFDGRTHPEVVSIIERTVVANSWSKTFAIPGERIGYLAISPRLPEAAALLNACTFSQSRAGIRQRARHLAKGGDGERSTCKPGHQQLPAAARPDVRRDWPASATTCSSPRALSTFFRNPRSPTMSPSFACCWRRRARGSWLGLRPRRLFPAVAHRACRTIERSLAAFERAFARSKTHHS